MGLEYVDDDGNESTVKCPLFVMEAMRIRHLPTLGKSDLPVDEWETDCLGPQCGRFRACCSDVVSHPGAPEVEVDLTVRHLHSGMDGPTDAFTTCPACSKQVRRFQNGRISRHKDQGGEVCAGYRAQRDMGEGTGA